MTQVREICYNGPSGNSEFKIQSLNFQLVPYVFAMGDNLTEAISLQEAETELFHAKFAEEKQSSRRFFCGDLRNLRETFWKFFFVLPRP